MTLETFQAVKFGGSKGGLGRAQRAGAEAGAKGRKRGAGRWRRASRRRVGRSGQGGQATRPYSYHRQSFQSATYKTGGGY